MGTIIKKDIEKLLDRIIKYKNTPLEDKAKLAFFEEFNKRNSYELFNQVFKIDKTMSSSSANGFISFISFKKDSSIKFVLKTPKSFSHDDPEIEYEISKELTKRVVSKNLPKCIAKTWGSLVCVPNYVHKGDQQEKLDDKDACIKNEEKKKTNIIMDYIRGETYGDMIKKGSLNLKEIMDVLSIVLCNLYILRKETGFTHYDLHYGNIMVEKLDKEKIYKFNYEGNVIEIITKYNPVFIDFGRTYIKNSKVKQNREKFYYNKQHFDLIKERFITSLVKPLSNKEQLMNAFEDILQQFVKLIDDKNSCTGYSSREQSIILSSTIILNFISSTGFKEKITDEDFTKYLFEQYYTKEGCRMDITSDRQNNVCDFLKISMLIFEVLLSKMSAGITVAVQPVFNELFLNFPYILPGQNFLPFDKIKYPNKTRGIFCLDNEMDLLKIMSEYNLISKKYIKKTKSNLIPPKRYSLLQIYKPVQKNREYVKNLLLTYTPDAMRVDLGALTLSPGIEMSVESFKLHEKEVGGLKRRKAYHNLNELVDSPVASVSRKKKKRVKSVSKSISKIEKKLKKLEI